MAAPVWATNDVPTATDFNVWLTNIIAAVKTATESITSSTTLQNDDELVIALAANSTYWLHGIINYDAGATGDLRTAFTGPASSTLALSMVGLSVGAAGGSDGTHVSYVAYAPAIATFGGTGAGDNRTVTINGTVKTVGTAGNLQFQWCQDTSSAGATRVFALSALWATRIS